MATRKADTDDGAELISANIRLPRVLVDAIDRIVDSENAANPYRPRTRADVVRDLLAEAVLQREAPAPKAKHRARKA